jgi:hypothetical protein
VATENLSEITPEFFESIAAHAFEIPIPLYFQPEFVINLAIQMDKYPAPIVHGEPIPCQRTRSGSRQHLSIKIEPGTMARTAESIRALLQGASQMSADSRHRSHFPVLANDKQLSFGDKETITSLKIVNPADRNPFQILGR